MPWAPRKARSAASVFLETETVQRAASDGVLAIEAGFAPFSRLGSDPPLASGQGVGA
jgi:hypothetical protein